MLYEVDCMNLRSSTIFEVTSSVQCMQVTSGVLVGDVRCNEDVFSSSFQSLLQELALDDISQ